MVTRYFLYFILCSLSIGCIKDAALQPENDFSRNMPGDFSLVSYPNDNEYTEARWLLGKKLFYDNILSVDTTMSCASCHKVDYAFSDNVALSKGVKNRVGVQNAPTLANVAYHPYYTRAGGVPTLEMQVLVPLQEHNEFDFNIILAAERIAKDSVYASMSWKAYQRVPDAYVITKAIANFERELVSKNSRFDQYYYQKSETLDENELAGMALFYSERTNCFRCHSGANFTNYEFENNGLYTEYNDLGRQRLTGIESDNALFKVPTLRNIALTSPYMHDGSLARLDDVIEHYNKGVSRHKNQSVYVAPLNLSNDEKTQIIAFLNSLTDTEFISKKIFSNE